MGSIVIVVLNVVGVGVVGFLFLRLGQDSFTVTPSNFVVPSTVVVNSTPSINWLATREAIKTQIPEVTADRPTGIFEDTTDFYQEGSGLTQEPCLP